MSAQPTQPSDGSPRLALVTGASSGLGEEFARQLAAQGYNLILTARRKDRLEALAAGLSAAHGVECNVYAVDLTDAAQRAGLCEVIRGLPRLDLLINNAGFGTTGSFASQEVTHHTDMLHVHLDATVELTHAALPGMRARKSGGIINVASVAAFFALPGGGMYGATKAALVTFSEVLAVELQRSGIHVQALCPGFTYTEFHDAPLVSGFKRNQLPRFLWGPADAVIRQSLRDLGRNKVVVIPGGINRFLAFWGRNKVFHPFVQPIVRLIFNKRP